MGIGLPIALSFMLQELAGASPLQAFSTGAALCSKSLGTTLTILGTSGPTNTGLGTALTTAAILDDVVCLYHGSVVSKSRDFGHIVHDRETLCCVCWKFDCLTTRMSLLTWDIDSMLNRKRGKALAGILQRLFMHNKTGLLIHTETLPRICNRSNLCRDFEPVCRLPCRCVD